MTGKQGNRRGYGEDLIGTWVLIIIASGIAVALGLNGAVAVIAAAVLLIGFAAAGAKK